MTAAAAALPYVPLCCKSNYSFLEGASHPDELLEQAHTLGITTLALTDRDGVYGVVRAHLAAKRLGLRVIIGAEVTVDDGATVVLLAENRAGYANLCRLITCGRRRAKKGSSQVSYAEVAAHADGLCALLSPAACRALAQPEGSAAKSGLHARFAERLYVMLLRHRVDEEATVEKSLRLFAHAEKLPLVATVEVLYHHPARRPLQDVLTCIRHKVTLASAGRLIRENGEHGLKAPFVFAELFRDDPAAVAHTRALGERCQFSLDELCYRYPAERLPDGTSSASWLRQLTFAGARARYDGDCPQAITAQLDKELALIDELDYCGYFLTMYELVQFCRAQNILCQGRGSAANSAVCYCLGITAVDPVRMGLLFERFISRERAEPPDIDLDIEHNRREEVIQHVYAKYGRERAAMVANVIRYRARSAVRDVGQVLGIAETALDRMAKLLSHYGAVAAPVLAAAGLDPTTGAGQHLYRLANELLDFPRHLSIHPGGFLLGQTPVHELVPIENATMADRTVIQWDKDDLEALKLFKVDLLGLGALHHLHLCFDLLAAHRGLSLSMAALPADDAATFEMICAADTVGVFQIESRAQMVMLPRLRPRHYYDLVVEISLVRPGPISGGMVHPYLRRRHGLEPVDYPHPSLRPVLERTLGVPLFQEQVMRLAVVAADYTPGEADQLRRDMAAWRQSGRLEQHRERLVRRMEHKGIESEFAERVFEQIRGFGEYGFPESHAASFALIAYATAYLRCHFPAEFVCALLNAQPMGFYLPATLVGDAKRHGIAVRPIDVGHSAWDCTLEPVDGSGASDRTADPAAPPQQAVRMGLRYIKGLSRADADKLFAARAVRPFSAVEELVRRTHLAERVLTRLSEAGALGSLEGNRRSALWQVQGYVRAKDDALSLSSDESRGPAFPSLDALETILWDFQASLHSTRGHPLAPLRAEFDRRRLPTAQKVSGMKHGTQVTYVGLVICRQRPGTAGGVTFMTMEDETGFVNVVLWPKVFERYAVKLKTENFLGLSGKLQVEQTLVHLIVDHVFTPPIPRRPAAAASRDFH